MSVQRVTFPSLFPEWVQTCAVEFDPDAAHEPPAHLRRAVSRRVAEFHAGRFCAATALRALEVDGAVATGADRAPIWPAGVVGSITHTNRFAAAAVALDTRARAIGLDTEHVLDERTLPAVQKFAVMPFDPTRVNGPPRCCTR